MVFTYMLVGAALLAVILVLARLFAKANPATLAGALKWVGGTLAALLLIFLVVRGFGHIALPLAFLALMMLRRRLGRSRRGGPFGGFGFPGRAQPTPGQSSAVETAYLRMALEHDSGEMKGCKGLSPDAIWAAATSTSCSPCWPNARAPTSSRRASSKPISTAAPMAATGVTGWTPASAPPGPSARRV